MKSRTLAMAAVALAGITVGATLVHTVTFGKTSNAGFSSSAASPAPQSTSEYVFACVNKSGKIDYLGFRAPLPASSSSSASASASSSASSSAPAAG